MVTSESWAERMEQDMQLQDLRPRTREAYLLAVKLFLRRVACEPAQVTEQHVRDYVLHLRQERKQAPSSIKVAIYGLRFFFTRTLGRDWQVFALLRVKQPRRLPVVLTGGEVRAVLGAVRHPVRRMALLTIYAMGLRLGEGLRLTTEHIDAARLTVWVRDGKGARDRGVPLPRPLLQQLRRYWKADRPQRPGAYLFVSSRSAAPLHDTTLQKTFAAACAQVALPKRASIHSLRHSYATHLIEAGISLRTIQALLGHKSLRTTELYTHVTQPGAEHLQRVLDRLMADL